VQLVTVVGEPGVGKSRLVAELFAYIAAKPEFIRWRQGRCLPYGEGITFWALGEIVKAEAGILESDSVEVAAAKLDAAVSSEEPGRRWLVQRLGPLVGVEAASPAERQELFTAWRRYLEGLAAARPSVLVFEDLHWADEALLAFLEHLAEWAEGCRCSFSVRPGRSCTSGTRVGRRGSEMRRRSTCRRSRTGRRPSSFPI
jgi:predicted ATPase